MDLPLFDGDNPDEWILRAGRYFKFHHLEETEKVEAAVVALEGDALLWFQWENGRREVRSWEEFKGLVLRQFRPTAAGTLHEQNHKQLTGGVAEYRRKFI